MNEKNAKKVFRGKIFSVWQWEQKLYDGTTKTFEHVTRTDAVRVIGVMPDKRILFVWDEQPDREGVLSMAGGQIDADETPEKSAKREFLEETGYEVGTLTPIATQAMPGRIVFSVHYFIGQDLTKKTEPQQSPGEKISLRFFTFDEFLALGHDESLRDQRIRITLLEAQIDPKKKEMLYKMLYE
ncbi:MAG TPA: NUDIX hydrolase [Candidatus Andersenbacteria bacterium]|nr:NUDIX hydrolase [Candidatus Andersenbacteria bacterium]